MAAASEQGHSAPYDKLSRLSGGREKELLRKWARERARDGPSKSTRAWKQAEDPAAPAQAEAEKEKTGEKGKVARIGQEEFTNNSESDVSCTITLADGATTMDAEGMSDDGSDETIVSLLICRAGRVERYWTNVCHPHHRPTGCSEAGGQIPVLQLLTHADLSPCRNAPSCR